ncbi:MAG: hypothetical protein V4494_02760 [Chlamydiota bacterium]
MKSSEFDKETFSKKKIRKDLRHLGLDSRSISALILRVKGRLLGEESMTTHDLKEIILQELKQMDAVLQKPAMASRLEEAPKDSFLSKCIQKRVSDMPLDDLNELANLIEFQHDPENRRNNIKFYCKFFNKNLC